MIPKKNDKREDNLETMQEFVNLSQSEKVKRREHRKQNPLKFYKQEYKVGLCSLCKSTDKKIVNLKYTLCATCREWCKRWIVREYGRFAKNQMMEAIEAFREPVKCRFYDICKHISHRVHNGRIRDHYICDSCKPIYKSGFEAGRRQLLKLRKRKDGKSQD